MLCEHPFLIHAIFFVGSVKVRLLDPAGVGALGGGLGRRKPVISLLRRYREGLVGVLVEHLRLKILLLDEVRLGQ